MDNLNSPAYPSIDTGGDKPERYEGFTKLELASLMAMQGLMAGRKMNVLRSEYADMAESSVFLAKAVLERANQ